MMSQHGISILIHLRLGPPFAKTCNTTSSADDYTNSLNCTITERSQRKACQVSSAKLDIY